MAKAKTLIKICGITTLDQAICIAELGVNAIGIISVKESPRYVSPLKKKEIFKNLKEIYPNIKRVSVVKNLKIETISNDLIDYENVIQLHGDEDLEYCKDLKKGIQKVELWKAFRIKNKETVSKIESFKDHVDAVLLDSWNKETYGGSGIRINQKYLQEFRFSKPWWLAGGISKDWAEEIITDIRPNGIDISSSIEKYPGIKDISKTKELISEINKYLQK